MLDLRSLQEAGAPAPMIPSWGKPDSDIIIVMPAPRAEEARTLKPFTSNAGALMKDCMLKAGIPEYKVYITYLIKERPAGDAITKFFNGKTFTSKGQPYVARLREELMKLPGKVIVAVGNEASYALCGIPSVMKHRGSILESTLLPGRKVISTINPSMALRTYELRYSIIHDLRKALNQSGFPEIKHPVRNLITNATITDFYMWYREFQARVERKEIPRRLAFDIEITGALELSCFALSYDPKEAICIPVDKYSADDEMSSILLLAEILEDPTMEIIGQNVNFDLFFCLRRYNINPKCVIQDTMIAHNVLYPGLKKGLDFLCSIYTDEPYYKDEGKEWRVIRDYQKFWRYNAKDAACTLEIWQVLEQQLDVQGFRHTYQMDVEKHYPMFFPMFRGIRADPPAVQQVKEDLEKTIWRLQEELDTLVEGTITNKTLKVVDKETQQMGYLNEASPKQVMSYFYVDLGIAPYLSKGKPTCDDKALQRLAKGTASRKPIKAAAIIQELRKHRKFRNTYLNINFDADDRFRCMYNPRGTIFGRLSSSQTIFHTGMNQQNLPSAYKHFLLADEGYLYFELDGIQAEWVATAYIANEARMMDVIESGKDPHAATAEMLTNLPMDLVKWEDKRIGHTTDPGEIEAIRTKLILENTAYAAALKKITFLPRIFSFRQCGKKSNHGFNYGMGPDTFALYNETPNSDARNFHKFYHIAYPGLSNWYERTQYELKRNRTLVNPFGRKIRLIGRWSFDLFNQAYSFRPQSTVADQVRNAIDIIYRKDVAGDSIVKPSEFLSQVHDSMGYQYPLSEDAEKIALFIHMVKDALEQPITYEGREFIIRAECKAGFNWGEIKDLSLASVTDTIQGIEKLKAERYEKINGEGL